MTPYDMVREQLTKTVPFAAHVGVELLTIDEGRATAQLAQREETSNHIATQHAGAMFTLGEAASGAALAGALMDRLMNIRPVAAKADINYVAIAKGTLTATAETSRPVPEIKAQLDEEGKVQFDVHVILRDQNDQEVAVMTVSWHVRPNQ
ncbi:MAG: YiiD C-terminal domain-containing protein [Pseudomonadota bacterium]